MNHDNEFELIQNNPHTRDVTTTVVIVDSGEHKTQPQRGCD
jgi:hypothetical protein